MKFSLAWFLKRLGSSGTRPMVRPSRLSEAQQHRANLERLLTLAGLPEDHQLWQVVLSYADEHARNELEVALRPGLTDADRQFSVGRAASADDFAQALRDLRLKAEQQARKMKER